MMIACGAHTRGWGLPVSLSLREKIAAAHHGQASLLYCSLQPIQSTDHVCILQNRIPSLQPAIISHNAANLLNPDQVSIIAGTFDQRGCGKQASRKIRTTWRQQDFNGENQIIGSPVSTLAGVCIPSRLGKPFVGFMRLRCSLHIGVRVLCCKRSDHSLAVDGFGLVFWRHRQPRQQTRTHPLPYRDVMNLLFQMM